jgi:hypothetical protein
MCGAIVLCLPSQTTTPTSHVTGCHLPPAPPTVPLVHSECPRGHVGGSHLEVSEGDEVGEAQAAGVAGKQGQYMLFKVLGRRLPAAGGQRGARGG